MLHGAVEFGQLRKLFFAVKVTFPGCEIFGGFYGKPGSFLYIGEVAGSGSRIRPPWFSVVMATPTTGA